MLIRKPVLQHFWSAKWHTYAFFIFVTCLAYITHAKGRTHGLFWQHRHQPEWCYVMYLRLLTKKKTKLQECSDPEPDLNPDPYLWLTDPDPGHCRIEFLLQLLQGTNFLAQNWYPTSSFKFYPSFGTSRLTLCTKKTCASWSIFLLPIQIIPLQTNFYNSVQCAALTLEFAKL